MRYSVLIPQETRLRAESYFEALRAGSAIPGKHLRQCCAAREMATIRDGDLLHLLLNTKLPQIFAESAVSGDGADWNLTELGILGDISVAVPVTIFDDGGHQTPLPHHEPFRGTLVFTPGALLRNGRGLAPADWAEVTRSNGTLDSEGYFRLYERRLLPVFAHVNAQAAECGKPALITIPGLGCGQFAGPFHGQLGPALLDVLRRFLEKHGRNFPSIRAVYYDPYTECENARFEIHHLSLLVRPLLHGNAGKSQLCHPVAFAEEGDDFSGCALFSIVAWDHVSWPGNDFFAGSRCTDDGVKAAATDSMAVLTGVAGQYDATRAAYLPPAPFHTWEQVVSEYGLRLEGAGLG